MSFTILHDVHINATKDKIFQAISEADHLINWWPLRAKSNAKLNGVYNFYFTNEYDWFGKVVSIDSPNSVAFEMMDCDEDWNGTIVFYQLEQKENGVNLKFAHGGWKTTNQHYRRTS